MRSNKHIKELAEAKNKNKKNNPPPPEFFDKLKKQSCLKMQSLLYSKKETPTDALGDC